MKSWWIALSLCLIACAGAQDDERQSTAASSGEGPSAGEPLEPSVESTPGSVTSATLERVLGRSAGDFLRSVEVEAETQRGSFVGWRLVGLPSSQPSWLDVRTGDVVTAINGLPLERPEDAQRVWETLRIASEIRIDLTRAGERRSIRIAVVDGDGATEQPADDHAERVGPEQ